MTENIHDYDEEETIAAIDHLIRSAFEKAKGNKACMADFAKLLIKGGVTVAITNGNDAQAFLFKEICDLPTTDQAINGDIGATVQRVLDIGNKAKPQTRMKLVETLRDRLESDMKGTGLPLINYGFAFLHLSTEIFFAETQDRRVTAILVNSAANEIENTPLN